MGASPGRSGTRSAIGAPTRRHAAHARLDRPRDAEAEGAGDLEPRGVAALGGRGAGAGGEAAREEDRGLGGAVLAEAAHLPARGLGPRAPRRVGELEGEAVAGGHGAGGLDRGGRRAAGAGGGSPRRGARRPPRGRRRRGSRPASSSRRGRAAAQVPSAAAWTSALSARRLSSRRSTRLGVVTHCGSQGAGRVRRCLSSWRISGLGVSALRPRPAAGKQAESARSAATGSGRGRRGNVGQRPVRRTVGEAPRASARRRSVSRRFIPGETRKSRMVWSRPTGPLQVRE